LTLNSEKAPDKSTPTSITSGSNSERRIPQDATYTALNRLSTSGQSLTFIHGP